MSSLRKAASSSTDPLFEGTTKNLDNKCFSEGSGLWSGSSNFPLWTCPAHASGSWQARSVMCREPPRQEKHDRRAGCTERARVTAHHRGQPGHEVTQRSLGVKGPGEASACLRSWRYTLHAGFHELGVAWLDPTFSCARSLTHCRSRQQSLLWLK